MKSRRVRGSWFVALAFLTVLLVGAALPAGGAAQNDGMSFRSGSADLVSFDLVQQIAMIKAQGVWGKVAPGSTLPCYDDDGQIVAYMFPFALGKDVFPTYEQIMEGVREGRRLAEEGLEGWSEVDWQAIYEAIEQERLEAVPTGEATSDDVAYAPVDEETDPWTAADDYARLLGEKKSFGVGKYGTVVVSATYDDFPIPVCFDRLPDYYSMGDLALAKAREVLGDGDAELARIYFLGLARGRWFEFGDGSGILINAQSLEVKATEEVLISEGKSAAPDPIAQQAVEEEWERWEATVREGGEWAAADRIIHIIDNDECVPDVLWTRGCGPTAASMVLGFWDNYVAGTGGRHEWGRLIDYWQDLSQYVDGHTGVINNVPNILEELRIAMKTDGNGSTDCDDLSPGILKVAKDINGYNFASWRQEGSSSNDWNWSRIQEEVNANRPFVWSLGHGTVGHFLAAFGYTDDKYVVCHDTYVPFGADYWYYNQYQGGETGRADIHPVVPVGPTNWHDLVIEQPDSGEFLHYPEPAFTIKWHQYGQAIKSVKLSYSPNGGDGWNTIASSVPSFEWDNQYDWDVPDVTLDRVRVKVEGFDEDGNYIAGDGSQVNLRIGPAWYDLDIRVSGTGTTTPAPGIHPYAYEFGTDVSVTAMETDPYWKFNHWSGLGLEDYFSVDQAQEGLGQGFWFDSNTARWQEFRPTQPSLSKFELYIRKDGNPGNLRVAVVDSAFNVLWCRWVLGDDITTGWVGSFLDIPVVPGDPYYIYVSSDTPSSDPANRYYWLGQTESAYYRGISSVEEAWPAYDFAFRTWSWPSENTITVHISFHNRVQANFVPTPEIEATPSGFDLTLPPDSEWTGSLAIENDGPGVLSYSIEDLEAGAGPIDVLLVTDDDESSLLEVQAYLSAFPDIAAVDVFEAREGTPSLPLLQGYDAVLVWSAYAFADAVALGDVLADYADSGGGVVVATWVWVGSPWGLEGRLMDEWYTPFVRAGSSLFSDASLGWHNTAHPIMAGIGSISGYYRDSVSVIPGADLIAEWDDGHPFVAARGSVVGLALYPGIEDAGHDWTGDVPMLVHNSLVWSATVDCSWVTETPASGEVMPGATQYPKVTVSSAGLAPGEYTGEIWISSNDANENPTVVPVRLTVIQRPVVRIASPAFGYPGQGEPIPIAVTITGNYLTSATAISFGEGIAVLDFSVDSDSQIMASIVISTTAALGPRDVCVTTPAGTGCLEAGFTVTSKIPPVVTALDPSEGGTGQTMTVVITGDHFVGATSVSFGPDITVTQFDVGSETVMKAAITISPTAAPGPRDVCVTTPAGTGCLTSGFMVIRTEPVVTAVIPSDGDQGQTMTVVITGNYFVGATWVGFGKGITIDSFTVDSGSHITAAITISPTAALGPRAVCVTTPAGTGCLVAGFTVTAPAPVVTAVIPSRGKQGHTMTVTITGDYFVGATSVSFGPDITVTQFEVRSDGTQMKAGITISPTAALGPRDVCVTTPGGTSCLAAGFTVTPPAPVVTAVIPSRGHQGQTMTVTIAGNYFVGATSVSFGAGITVNTFSADSETQITAGITISPTATEEPRDVCVTAPSGTGCMIDGFTVTRLAPTVTTRSASSITAHSASLMGFLDSPGADSSVQISFEWGTTTSYGKESFSVAMTSPGPFAYGLGGLSPDTTYHFRAKAVGDGTAYGEDMTFTTLFMSPTLLSPANGANLNYSTLQLDWTDASDVIGVIQQLQTGQQSGFSDDITYHLQVDDNDDFSSPIQEEAGLIASEYTVTESLSDGTYYWRVRVEDGEGNERSEWTFPWTFTVLNEQPVVMWLWPSQGAQGQTLTVVISGRYFAGLSMVDFGSGITVNSFSLSQSQVNGLDQITVNITIDGGATLGARDVSVTTPAGTDTKAGSFTVTGSASMLSPLSNTSDINSDAYADLALRRSAAG
ncbi:MAG: hypothetical protein JW753_02620 [Dehalococcoidia bacterium]|nr:hypothetical protein [Dehalococcoidia bacterium]